MRILRSCLALAVMACASGAGNQAHHEPGGPPEVTDSRFADEPLCQAAVANYVKIVQEDTTTDLFEKPLFDPVVGEHEQRLAVGKCTTTLSARQASCIAHAGSAQQMKNCEIYQ